METRRIEIKVPLIGCGVRCWGSVARQVSCRYATNRHATWAIMALATVLGSACGTEGPVTPDPSGPAPVAMVTVTPSSVTLESLREAVQLTATARDATGNVIGGKSATWSTSDPAVASVAEGVVTAVTNGTVTVTATIDGVNGTASVTVDQTLAIVIVFPATDTLATGEQLTLTAAATDALHNAIAEAQFSWKSSDLSVASVDDDGLVDTNGPGVVTITATSDGVEGQALLVVELPKPLIVFIGRDATEQDDVYTVQPVSGRITRLTNDAHFDFAPTWAPDRSEIAFGRDQNGQRDIWSIRPDGTGLRRINNDAVADQSPAWSPDGQIIAFEHLVRGNEIWQMTPTGGSLTLLAGPPDHTLAQHPSWFPSGNEIAYEAQVGTIREIWLMDANGENKTQITSTGGAKFLGSISPDGQTIVFAWRQVPDVQQTDIFTMNRDGTNVQQITNMSGVAFNPVWSPDGSEIAFWHGRLMIMNPDGSNMRALDLPLNSPGFFGLDW